MPTNYERIKNMTVEEMAIQIGNIYGNERWCEQCSKENESCFDEKTQYCNCIKYAKQWLQAESEE